MLSIILPLLFSPTDGRIDERTNGQINFPISLNPEIHDGRKDEGIELLDIGIVGHTRFGHEKLDIRVMKNGRMDKRRIKFTISF